MIYQFNLRSKVNKPMNVIFNSIYYILRIEFNCLNRNPLKVYLRYSKILKNYFNKVLTPYHTVSKPKTSSVCIGTFSCFKWRKANDKIAYGVCWNSIKAFWCQDVHLQHTTLFRIKKRTCHATPKHVWELILFEKKINLSGKKKLHKCLLWISECN